MQINETKCSQLKEAKRKERKKEGVERKTQKKKQRIE